MKMFENGPYLAPWYIDENKPSLFKDGSSLKWIFFEKIHGEYVGLWTLRDHSNNLLGLVKGYNYIYSSADGLAFIIWNRGTSGDINPAIEIRVYYPTGFKALGFTREDILNFSKGTDAYLFGGSSIRSIIYSVNPSVSGDEFMFPDEFKLFNPFFAVCNFKGLYDGQNGFEETIIVEFDTKMGTIKCFPQHWFNKSNADFGYQWITRAVRDKNGVIHGQGFRISDFILDETGCELKK